VDVDHGLIAKKMKKKKILKSSLEKLLAKTMLIVSANAISNFFGAIIPYKKDNVHHNIFVENLGLEYLVEEFCNVAIMASCCFPF
jgi:hypothetical protein